MIKYVLLAIFGYLIGSIPFSYLTAKFFGHIDIRKHGSGNSGATNVLRTLGAKAGIIAFILDFLKGFILACIGKYLFGIQGAVLASSFVVVGHCYPFSLGFKGGKGVATAGGTIFALYPLIGLLLIMIHFGIVYLTKMVSLASIIAAAGLPILSVIFKTPMPFILYSLCFGLFVIYKHKSNIQRLLSGTESKISFKK